ncbi:phasin family protein [Rhodobacteraceae bacterium NNCM2]|nr:phasin family protein [Coraliihabitans acroporae]
MATAPKAAATKKVDTLTAETQKTVEESLEKVSKGLEDATAFGQENMEAIVTSSKIAAKAAEDINAELMAYTKKSYEESMAAAKELTACKSVTEYFEKQNELAKTSFDGFVAEATKLNEMYSAATKEMFAPLTDRFSAASDMMKSFRV